MVRSSNAPSPRRSSRDGTRHHRHELDAFLVFRHRIAGEQRPERLRDVLRRQPQRPRAVLIDLEPDGLLLLVPVELHVARVGVGAHGVPHFLGHGAHAVAVRAEHAELHRETDGRPEVQPVDAQARLGDHVLRDKPFEPRLQPLARLRVLGHHDDEREALVRQHGVQGEEEAGRAFADIGRVVLEIRIALDEGFGLLGGGLGDADGRALRHADLDEELRSRRGREELLLYLREGGDGRAEGRERQGDDHPAEAHRPADGAAQGPIKARIVDVMAGMPGAVVGEVGQQLDAEIGREKHRHDPRDDEGEPDDPEDVAGILSRRRTRDADW